MAEFQEVMRQRKRICTVSECVSCPVYEAEGPLFCRMFMTEEPEKFEAVVMKWAAEHPEKTMKDVFFEKFPNAPKGDSGEPECCPRVIGFVNHPKCNIGDCCECWDRPAPEGY